MALAADLKRFPGLSFRAFQHPLDREARKALEAIPIVPTLVRKWSELVTERTLHMSHVGNNLRVSADQYPSLYRQYVRMAQALDMPKLPALYIETSHVINAYAMGMENYFIVVNTALMDLLTEDEVLAIIGHELGHIKCEHMLYKNMVVLMFKYGASILDAFLPGIAQVMTVGFKLALLEWNRKAEFSCDRAGLLATQKPEAIAGALSKLAGYVPGAAEEVNLDAVYQQAEDFDELDDDSLFNKIIKLNMLLERTHPFPVVRVKTILDWAESDQYKAILDGKYRELAQGMLPPDEANQRGLPTPTGRVCPRCRSVWPANMAFCGKCGTNLNAAIIICGGCGLQVTPTQAQCPRCGRVLRPAAEADFGFSPERSAP